jgi:hypothetical protein
VELELGCPFEHSKIVPSQKLAVIDKVSSQSQNPESKLDKLRSRALSSLNFVFTPLNLIQHVTTTTKKKKNNLFVTSLQVQTKKHQTTSPYNKNNNNYNNKRESLSLSVPS